MTVKIEIMTIEDARELLKLCGYPVYPAKWITYGGGAMQDFQTDEEVITFARDMQANIDQNIETMFGCDDQFTKAMENAGLLEKKAPTTGISKTVNQDGEEKVMGIPVKRIMSKHRYEYRRDDK